MFIPLTKSSAKEENFELLDRMKFQGANSAAEKRMCSRDEDQRLSQRKMHRLSGKKIALRVGRNHVKSYAEHLLNLARKASSLNITP